MLIHGKLRYLCVLCACYTHLLDYCIQIIHRVKHQPLFGKGKNGEVLLVRGVFLFDSLSYGDSAHEGNGVKR